MKRLITLISLLLIACALFASCVETQPDNKSTKKTSTSSKECSHQWKDATCAKPKTCTKCGDTVGSKLTTHSWLEATCERPSICSVCNKTFGSALEHNWQNATCTTPKICSLCHATEGAPINHNWQNATCSTPKTCSICQAKEGSPLNHYWKSATCTAPKTCNLCKKTEGSAKGHDYQSYNNNKCTRCQAPDPKITATLNKCSLELPSLPQEIKDYAYTSSVQSKISITNIVPTFEYQKNGKISLTIKISGTKTYDRQGNNQSSPCCIGWKLYDSDGNVFKSGTFYSSDLATGESFANKNEDLIYNFEAAEPGAYKLVLLDVN